MSLARASAPTRAAQWLGCRPLRENGQMLEATNQRLIFTIQYLQMTAE